MAGITTAICNVVKKNLFDGVHLAANTYKCALIKASMAGTYSKATTSYTDVTGNTDEASGTGYSAGGVALTRIATSAGDTVYLDFDDAVWTGTISARGCIVYDDTAAGKPALIVQDFGATVSSTAAEYRIAIANLLSMAG